jgi:hypothetical protein
VLDSSRSDHSIKPESSLTSRDHSHYNCDQLSSEVCSIKEDTYYSRDSYIDQQIYHIDTKFNHFLISADNSAEQ